MKIRTLLLVTAVTGGLVHAQTTMPPATYRSASELANEVATLDPNRPTMGVGRIAMNERYRASLIRRVAAATPIVHDDGHELHYITAGSATVVTGGIIVRPADGSPARVEGGETRTVAAGDVLMIPEGTPHWYQVVPDEVTYLEVRFDVE